MFCAGTVRIYLQSWVKARDRAMMQMVNVLCRLSKDSHDGEW